MSKSQAISVAGLRLRVIQLSAVCLIAGCASAPPAPAPVAAAAGEYTIPVIKADDSLEQFTVEREPGSAEEMLFCIESHDQTGVLCVTQEDGKASRYYMPMPEAPRKDFKKEGA